MGSIGVFDSGYGGLTILKEIIRALPQYNYIYLGDNARTPYGSRSFEAVYHYTGEAVRKLFDMGAQLVILACNTASAKALRSIQQIDLPVLAPERRVLGVIRPSVEALADYSRNGHVGILATRGTVASASYPLEIEKLYGKGRFHITQLACPMWVPLVENNELEGAGAEYFVRKYLQELFAIDPEIDTIILACTHYPLLRRLIEKEVARHVKIVGQGHIVADSLKDYLRRHPEMARKLTTGGTRRFLTTESAEKFSEAASIFLRHPVEAESIRLEE